LDEPTEGLAPVIVEQIGGLIRMLRERGYTILLVEQNFEFATTISDRHYIVDHGQVVDIIDGDAVEANREKLKTYLGV
jgi:branched-chain amino acid transport system ATP-binding protein